MLVFRGSAGPSAVAWPPKMAKYTIFCDAISKSFAATGLRVGWVVAPPVVAGRLRALLTHMGAWAPRRQVATAPAARCRRMHGPLPRPSRPPCLPPAST
ncbi:MAG: aminotransferase class I/II-fold pyridoxal phosphate-dependent enzyme [bacterium]